MPWRYLLLSCLLVDASQDVFDTLLLSDVLFVVSQKKMLVVIRRIPYPTICSLEPPALT
jgi:hypothetical protein